MKSVVRYFIKNPIAANMLMFALFAMGLVGYKNMKSTFFPETPSKIISIQLVYPGASPEEMEEGVVTKIEENLKGVTGVERVTSTSSENSGIVTVEVASGYNTDLILQDVKNAVDQISSFPVGLEPPVVFKQEQIGFGINFAISGEVDLKTLKRFGRQAEEELLAMDGISKVNLSGFPDEEIEISFRENDLRAYNITFQQATLAVQAANLDLTGGTIKGSEEELLIRARNKEYYAKGLEDIVVKTATDGSVIRLYQIANIRDRWSDNPNRSYLNGDPAVVVTVNNTQEEDLLSITSMVRDYVDRFNQTNDLVTASVIRDSSETLLQRQDLLVENGVIGFLIVVLLLAMFLHWRLAFWVALSIPISFAGMFLVASLLGITINVISLFGMILVIGILVDDGIVIGESIYQEYENGVPNIKAANEGTVKVIPAVFSAILTTVIAFSSFLFIEGQLGDFFSEMAIVVIFSLVFSLVEGVLILPTHVAHSKALSHDRKPNKIQDGLDRFFNFLRNKTFAPLLKFALHNKFLTFAVMLGLLAVTIGALGGGLVKTTFFPVIERDDISINLQMPAGTREHVTEKWLNHIEDAAWRANDMLSERFFNGEKQAILRVDKNLGPTSYQGTINIALLDGENRDSLRLREVTNVVRRETGIISEAELLTFGSASIFGKPISVSLVGEDYPTLKAATEAVKARMQQLTELADVVDNNQEGLKEINITLNEKAEFLGLNLQEVLAQVRRGFFGSEVQRLQRGRDEVRVWVRYDESDRSDLTRLEDMRVRFADGREFPLSEIADFSVDRGVVRINHIEGKREIKIEADVSNDQVSVSDLTNSLKTSIVPEVVAGFPGVTALFEGQNREQEKSAASIQIVGTVVLALMFFVVALTFRSVSQTLVVFSLIPFSFIGVGWGHYVMGTPISLFSGLGIIALAGVLVNDSLVLVTSYNKLLEQGRSQMDAIYEAGLTRFRPIILTTFTTFAGLAPLLFEKSLQAQFLIPMAISLSYGLLAVTVINLIWLPVLLVITNRFKVYASYLWNGTKPSFEAVEPVFRKENGYEFLWYVLLGLIAVMVLVSAL
ncbi:MAG: efflux RND transporter permease subunit [Saprospiraceae bacterium]|jgi:multidrug efflux pump subunit AcrB